MSDRAILVIGDVHGDFKSLEAVILHASLVATERDLEIVKIIQVGDFGYYPNVPSNYIVDNCQKPECLVDVPRYWIRGNHEDHEALMPYYHLEAPTRLPKASVWNYVPDCIIHEGILYVGGAWSIDRARRDSTSHPYRWHHNEQIDKLHVEKLLNIIDNPTLLNSIKIVITHDHPVSLYKYVVGGLIERADYSTSKLLERLYDALRFDADHTASWFAGHLGKSHLNPRAPRFGTPLQFNSRQVDFFSLDMVVGYKDIQKECDSWHLLTI